MDSSVSFRFTNFAICVSDDMQYRSTFSFTILNDLYMDSSVSSGFTNFAIQLICFVEHHLHHNIHNSLKINGCALKGVVYYKWRPIISMLL